MNVRAAQGLLGLSLLALAVLVSMPFIGMHIWTPAEIWSAPPDSLPAQVFWRLRVPRVLTAFFAGAGLSVCGLAMQALFRNPLATPFTLGVSSGAACGAAIHVLFLGPWFVLLPGGFPGDSLLAFIGALVAIALVYGLTHTSRNASTATMLLAGVAVSCFFSALILLMQYLSDYAQTFRLVRWMMGGLETVGRDTLGNLLPFVVCGTALLAYLHREMNLLLTGEELAGSRGVDVPRTRLLIFLATSLTVGGVVSVCGPIGFVGMITPHMCRLWCGPDHRWLIPCSFLAGGIFLTLCDTLARTIIAPAELPVGVLTALIGGPFFLGLLLRGNADRGLLS